MSAFDTLLGLGGVVQPVLRSIAAPAVLESELRSCMKRAFESAVRAQRIDPGELTDFLFSHLPQDGATRSFLPSPSTSDSGEERLGAGISRLLEDSEVADLPDLDLNQLDSDFATAFREEVEAAAAVPNSSIFPAYVVMKLIQLGGPLRTGCLPADPHKPITNMWSLPSAEVSVPRSERREVESILEKAGLAAVCGGAGVGKSTLARQIANEALDGENGTSAPVVWWIPASDRLQVISAADALLRELGVTPSDNPVPQLRAVLSKLDRWVLVMDNVCDPVVVSQIAPSRSASGWVLVTTRLEHVFPREQTVTLRSAAHTTMTEIAQRILPADSNLDAIQELVRASAGHPLAMATTCRYIASAGAPIAEVAKLLQSDPVSVLDTRGGALYEESFAEVVRVAFESLAGSTFHEEERRLMVAIAILGGIPYARDLLKIGAACTDIKFNSAVMALRDVGLIDASSSAVGCHSLVAAILAETVSAEETQAAATRMLSAISMLGMECDGAGVHQLRNALDSVDGLVAWDLPERIFARTALAEGFARAGLIDSAYKQLTNANEIAADQPSDSRVRILLLLSEASVSLERGDFREAKTKSRHVLELSSGKHERDIPLRAVAVLAQCENAVGNYSAAARWIEWAMQIEPNDRDLQHSHQCYLASQLPAHEQIRKFEALAKEAEHPAVIGYCYGMASRAAKASGNGRLAVQYAERALESDRRLNGSYRQLIARDLSDLGMALIENDQLEEAETALTEAIAIYEGEGRNGLADLPRLHFGRLLIAQANSFSGEKKDSLLGRARELLEPALERCQVQKPHSPDHSALLIASGDAVLEDDPDLARDRYVLAVTTDRELFGNDHIEVAIDITRLNSVDFLRNDFESIQREFVMVREYIAEWEMQKPDVAVQLLLAAVVAYKRLGVSPLQAAELSTLVDRLEQLKHDPRLDNEIFTPTIDAVVAMPVRP